MTDCEKDLGVHVDSELNFKRHIQESITKSNRTLMAIKRPIASRQEGGSEDVIHCLGPPAPGVLQSGDNHKK